MFFCWNNLSITVSAVYPAYTHTVDPFPHVTPPYPLSNPPSPRKYIYSSHVSHPLVSILRVVTFIICLDGKILKNTKAYL